MENRRQESKRNEPKKFDRTNPIRGCEDMEKKGPKPGVAKSAERSHLSSVIHWGKRTCAERPVERRAEIRTATEFEGGGRIEDENPSETNPRIFSKRIVVALHRTQPHESDAILSKIKPLFSLGPVSHECAFRPRRVSTIGWLAYPRPSSGLRPPSPGGRRTAIRAEQDFQSNPLKRAQWSKRKVFCER